MLNAKAILLAGAAAAVAAAQEPELTRGLSAMNAAGYAPAGLPYSGVTPGARFVVLGKNLGPAVPVVQQIPESKSLTGVSARITAGDSVLDAYVMSVSAGRIEVLLPRLASAGSGTVTLSFDGRELSLPIDIVASALGILTRGVPNLNAAGAGPAFALDASAAEIT